MDSYGLDQLILSEDKTCLIPAALIANLTHAMESINELFSPYIEKEDDTPTKLTPYEKEALIKHNPQNEALFLLHRQLRRYNNHGSKIGDHLHNLAIYLRKGGASRGIGEEGDAGSPAYVGLKEFYYHFNCLNENQKIRLRRMKIDNSDDQLTLGTVLDTLEGKPTKMITCVDVNAGAIERLLKNHPELSSETINLKTYQDNYVSLQNNITEHTSGKDTVRSCLYDITKRFVASQKIDAIAFCQALLFANKTEQEIATELDRTSIAYPNENNRAYLDLAYLLVRRKFKSLFQKISKAFSINVIQSAFYLAVDENNKDMCTYFLKNHNDFIVHQPSVKLAKAAIKLNNKPILVRCLQHRVDPFARDDEGIPLISYTSHLGAFDLVECMLMHLDTDVKGSNIYSAGLIRAISGHCDCQPLYDYLLQPGKADLSEDSRGKTPLDTALARKNWPLVDKMVDVILSKKNTVTKDVYHLSFVLLEAAKHNKFKLAQRCTTSFTNFNCYFSSGQYKNFNALCFAIMHKNYGFLKTLLCAGARPNEAMKYAIRKNDDEAIECILTQQNQNDKSEAHTRFLNNAIWDENEKLVDKTLELGIPDLGRFISGSSSLDLAFARKKISIIEKLIDYALLKQIKPAVNEKQMIPVLFTWLKQGKVSIVRKCVPLIKNFDWHCYEGRFTNFTLYHLAIYFKAYELQAALLEAGALPHFNPEGGRSAYEYACQLDDKKALLIIRNKEEKKDEKETFIGKGKENECLPNEDSALINQGLFAEKRFDQKQIVEQVDTIISSQSVSGLG